MTATLPSVSAKFEGQDTRLIEAAKHGDIGEVRALIAHGVDVNDADAGGVTALIMASSAGKLDAVEVLLDAGADPRPKDRLGYDAYHAAMFFGDFRGVALEPYDKIMALLKARIPGGIASAT